MIGYTRSMIVSITRGTISEHQVVDITSRLGRRGYYGKTSIFFIPKQDIYSVRDEVIQLGGQWDETRFENIRPVDLPLIPYTIKKHTKRRTV